ncbi:extracellular serine/threonine protein kinase four-jointed isoform X2 [Schistocerca americana]|uniref:extracellular serine/threonine protein kinase four-jointed isoform X2 n=1 Tax=Schistocerca americana TaxID=7009 RepID=UPI001F502F0D|nr:extracellular serine/threonine protein kinase four-jointed isoform X2 [Schistocerca americana]
MSISEVWAWRWRRCGDMWEVAAVRWLLLAAAAFALGLLLGAALPPLLVPAASAPPPALYAASAGSGATSPGRQRLRPPSSTASSATLPPHAPASLIAATGSDGAVSFVAPPPGRRTVVEDGVYWGAQVESSLPPGYGDADAERWRRYARSAPLARLEADGCGRTYNRLAVFADGERACCRYRQNIDQLQGEVFSYLLARELGLPNLPPATWQPVRARQPRWSRVRSQLALAQWADGWPVVLTRFLPELHPAHIPPLLRGPARRLHPPDARAANATDLPELAQWSDLLVFDFLTANLDRFINNLYNLQWNPAMMEAPAHNLARDSRTGLLVFLDNESGLLHGYRLLDKYGRFHADLLAALCVFRRRTADAVKRLAASGDVGAALERRFRRAGSAADGDDAETNEVDALPPLPEKSVQILNERLRLAADHIEACERRYA